MFAYATATIFVEPVGLLQRLRTTAVDAVRNRPQIALAGAAGHPGGESVSHVAYDRRTGEILNCTTRSLFAAFACRERQSWPESQPGCSAVLLWRPKTWRLLPFTATLSTSAANIALT